MSTQIKILNLAFHPSTPEAEAVVAFLKARRAVPKDTDFSALFGSNQPKSSSYYTPSDSKTSLVYGITVSLLNLPLFLDGLNNYKSTPYFSVKVISSTWRVLDRIKLEFTFELNLDEKEKFKRFMSGLADIINK